MSLIVHTPLCTVSLSCVWEEGRCKSTLENMLLLILGVALIFSDYVAISSDVHVAITSFLPHVMYCAEVKITNNV